MEKYLKRLCNAILKGRFNEEDYRDRGYWYGHEIETSPLFCSYGTIGFTVSVYDERGDHFCDVKWDYDMNELTIDDTPWREYINILFLEDHDINVNSKDNELESYTDAGGDMIISLEKIRKSDLQEYLDNFDIDDEIMLWWAETTSKQREERGLPFDNIKEHYEDLEQWKNFMQGICNLMPF